MHAYAERAAKFFILHLISKWHLVDMQCYVSRCWCARSPGTHSISKPVCQVWGTSLIVADSMFTSFHSATQFPPNLTTNPCLPPQNRLSFLPPCILSCIAECFCCQVAPQILCFQNPPGAYFFCALQQRRVEPRRCDLGEDTFHIKKQANQEHLRWTRSGRRLCVILRHGIADHGTADQNAETRQRGALAHTVPRLCAVRRQHILVIC